MCSSRNGIFCVVRTVADCYAGAAAKQLFPASLGTRCMYNRGELAGCTLQYRWKQLRLHLSNSHSDRIGFEKYIGN
jgi:hypothetical protein